MLYDLFHKLEVNFVVLDVMHMFENYEMLW